MRVAKEYEERRKEILTTAQRLFSVKGYDKCSVNDILKEIGIAKGTFYYYFASKEELLDAMIEQVVEAIKDRLEQIMKQTFASQTEKLLAAALAMRVKEQLEEGFLDELHRPDNALMHQKSLVKTEEAVLPYFVRMVEAGVESGEFVCAFPEEYMTIFLTSAMLLLDDGFFSYGSEKQTRLLRGLVSLLAKMLGIEEEKCFRMLPTL